MLDTDKITEIYFIIDEFFKEFDKTIAAHSLNEKDAIKKRALLVKYIFFYFCKKKL